VFVILMVCGVAGSVTVVGLRHAQRQRVAGLMDAMLEMTFRMRPGNAAEEQADWASELRKVMSVHGQGVPGDVMAAYQQVVEDVEAFAQRQEAAEKRWSSYLDESVAGILWRAVTGKTSRKEEYGNARADANEAYGVVAESMDRLFAVTREYGYAPSAELLKLGE
jgi:hypothetical protein